MYFYWPIALTVLSNVVYHICAKSTPQAINPLASLTITYLLAALASALCYFALSPQANLLREYQHLNWTAVVLALAVVGLEVGSIYMYKVGWNINSGALVQGSLLAVALLVVGLLLYHEAITWTKVAGVAVCLLGVFLLRQ